MKLFPKQLFPNRNRKRNRNRNRNRNRKRKFVPASNSNQESDNMNQRHKEKKKDEEEEGGLKVSTPTNRDYQPIREIIDISTDDDDDDMELQLALFHSSSCNHNKTPQTIDLKQKGILQQSFSLTPKGQRFRKFYQLGESSVVECVICKDTTSSGSVLRANNNCRHPFCKTCIQNYVAQQLQENIHKIMCPQEKCHFVLEQNICQQFVPQRLSFVRKEAITEGSVLASPYIFWCPFEDCSDLIVDDEKGFLIRACPNCWKIYCVKCLVPWHVGMTCDEFQRFENRKRLELFLEALQALSPQHNISRLSL